MEIFHDCQIVLDLSTSVNFKKKQEIRKKITENGGIISYIVTKKSTHLVCNDLEKADISYKCKMATKYALPVVSVDFIHDSVDQGKLLNTDNYILVGKTRSGEFNSGKILASKYQSKEAKKKKFKIDPKGVKIWKLGDKNGPEYDEENYEVAKFAMFQKFEKIKETTWFYNLEIHVTDVMDTNRSDYCRFRVFSHSGSTQDLQEAVTECRYVTSSDDALHVYSYLYNEQTRPAHNMELVYQPSSTKIGSKKFQRMVDEFGLDNSQLSPPVVDLMEHIWKEATGELEDEISIPLQSIKLEQIEKAEAILMKLKGCSDNDKRKELVKEFYSSLPHRTNHIPSNTELRSWMAEKQDICQMIKDMVAVSESTNWSTISSTTAKYKALRCRVDSLDTTNAEYKEIKEHIIQSLKHNEQLSIEQMFCVRRGVEEDNFRKQLHPQKLLFHASKVQNFVGILSRGLLLPKVIVDDFGGSRSDAGMLGNGIYYASSASTSIQYSDCSHSKGTRMMLVSNVALGNSKSFTEFQKDLQGPPEGYDSCHGIASSDGEKSEFKDDEYVIYNTNQQVAQYLVEFSMKGDMKNPLQIDVSLEEEEMEETDTGDNTVDLNDVSGIKNPLDKVQPGLVSTTGEACVLRSVHISAQLMDLASKVVVLQEYHNTSRSTLEAKYVFPLDDMAAVCGFEAFINDKHIIGEVKEKETAHKEYKKAISEGHGAYLMDQDEETPDVFTVSVGNLPPGCVALIKITYVSELQVEGELINFSIPGSVAPWKQETSNIKNKAGDVENSLEPEVETELLKIHINKQPGRMLKISLSFKGDDESAFISYLTQDGPAAEAGVRVGDQLVSINGVKVTNANYLSVHVVNLVKSSANISLVLAREKIVKLKQEGMDGKCSIQVAVEMPFVIRTINCPTHRIKKKSTATKCVVETLSGQDIADGFQLLIGLAEIHVPRMWVEDDENENQTQAAMLTFYPEFEAAEDNEIEVILVLDLSNSMKGKALLEAKKVLLLTLKHLPAHSLFNIVVFGTSYKELFPNSRTKTKSTIKTAEQFIKGIQANLGNTEVYRPLHSFFLLKSENSVRNIFVISDGHVNNEETTLKAVHDNCQHTRIFTFGISSIANKHVLKALSRLGAGSFEYFDSSAKSKWEGKVKSQIQKASQPVLTSVSVAWGMSDGPPSIQAPKQITALFNGSRLVVYGFVKNCEMATLKAEIGGQEISTVVYTSELSITKGQNLHRLTAKAIIKDWEDGVLSPDSVDHQLKKMDMKDYIIELSKTYSIVTQLTSFIAVEKREKNEIIPSDQQIMPQLISDEDVDFLSYIGWEGDEHERDEEELSNCFSSTDDDDDDDDVYEDDIYQDLCYDALMQRAENVVLKDIFNNCFSSTDDDDDDDDDDVYEDAMSYDCLPCTADGDDDTLYEDIMSYGMTPSPRQARKVMALPYRQLPPKPEERKKALPHLISLGLLSDKAMVCPPPVGMAPPQRTPPPPPPPDVNMPPPPTLARSILSEPPLLSEVQLLKHIQEPARTRTSQITAPISFGKSMVPEQPLLPPRSAKSMVQQQLSVPDVNLAPLQRSERSILPQPLSDIEVPPLPTSAMSMIRKPLSVIRSPYRTLSASKKDKSATSEEDIYEDGMSLSPLCVSASKKDKSATSEEDIYEDGMSLSPLCISASKKDKSATSEEDIYEDGMSLSPLCVSASKKDKSATSEEDIYEDGMSLSPLCVSASKKDKSATSEEDIYEDGMSLSPLYISASKKDKSATSEEDIYEDGTSLMENRSRGRYPRTSFREDRLRRPFPRSSSEEDSLRIGSIVPTIAIMPTVTDSKKEEDKQPEVPSWRTGLRKTGSTSAVLENNKYEADKNLSRSLSSHRISVERNSVDNDKSLIQRSIDTQDKPLERISAYSRNINNPYRSITLNSSSYQSAYVPYYRRQQEQNEQRERERDANKTTESTTQQPTTSAATLSSVTTATTTVSTVTPFSSCPNFVTNYSSRRSYEVPKRDEEAEIQRKARAKRARETRRSTQGVTLEDIQKAEEVLHSTDTKPSDKSNNNVIPENDRTCNIEQPEPARRRYRTDDETRSSFRRSRDSKDSSSIYSTDSTSAYVPRRERNALSTSIDNKSSLGSSDIRRSASLRSSRLLTEDQDDIDSKKDSKGDDKDEKKGPSAIRARRNRRERRSTGIVAYDPSKDDDEDEKKDSEEKDKCSARKSAIEDKSEDMPAKKEESQRSLPRPAKKEESQRSLDRTPLMEEMGLRFRSAAKEQSEPTSDAKEQSAPTSATKGQTEPTVSWRSCGVPDQFKDMFSKARVMKKKCSATDSSYSKVPEKEHFVQDRDDDEGFLPLLTKHTEEVSQPSYNLTDFGIGSVIIPVKKGKSLVHRYNLEKLYALQEEDGSWKLTPELCLLLGIEYDTCMNILKDAGIKSLALKVQEEIIVLLATSLTLLFIIQQISPNWVSQHVLDQSWQEQLTKWLPNEMDNPIIFSLISGTKNKGTSQWSNMMTFYQQKEQEYKWTSYMLELGHCWALVAARMLALV